MKLNYFSLKNFKGKDLLINEQGNYIFLEHQETRALVEERYDDLEEAVKAKLKEEFFIYDEDDDVFIERASHLYRGNKRYLFDATSLHIMVMTNACNMNCVYCQAQDSGQFCKGLMDKKTAEQAADIAIQAPGRSLTIEFQGGEPLMNFPVIRHMVEYFENIKNDKEISYTIVTNTLLLTDEIIDFFKRYNFSVSTSLDGDKRIHNSNRPRKDDGKGTFDIVHDNIIRLQNSGIGTGAIQTTTRKGLNEAESLVNTYRALNLHNLFVRPLTPLGYAREHWDEIGYSPQEFIAFYRSVLDEIIKCNLEGYHLSEGHAVIFLRKILGSVSDNYMELRSPCGAGVGQMAYYYDGNIYTCDEGRMLQEMGLPDFRLGNVSNTYDELMDSRVCRITCQASVMESIPQCCDCPYHPYCGVCPVVTYALEQNIYARQSNGYQCTIYKGMLDTLFEYLLENEEVTEIFKTWI